MNLQEFVGQTRLIEELKAMVKRKNWCFILRGHYGFGKTTLAIILAAAFGLYSYQIPHKGEITLDRKCKVHVVDETHLVREFEPLYEHMDYYNFIFCTNMASKLPEPFMSRCYTYRLEPYTLPELTEIVGVHSKFNNTPLCVDTCRFVAARSKGVPRNAVKLMERYTAICSARRQPFNVDTAATVFQEIGIDDTGLTELDRKYLTAVSTHPKSQKTLMAVLDVDQTELERMEHYLIHQGLVEITSRGRLAT